MRGYIRVHRLKSMHWRLFNRPHGALTCMAEKVLKFYSSSLINGRQFHGVHSSSSSGNGVDSAQSRFSRRKDRQAKRVFLHETAAASKGEGVTNVAHDHFDTCMDFATSSPYQTPVFDEELSRVSGTERLGNQKSSTLTKAAGFSSFASSAAHSPDSFSRSSHFRPSLSNSKQEASDASQNLCSFSIQSATNRTPESITSYLLSLRRAYAACLHHSRRRSHIFHEMKLFLLHEFPQHMPSVFASDVPLSSAHAMKSTSQGSASGESRRNVVDAHAVGKLAQSSSQETSLYWTVELAEEILLSYASSELDVLEGGLADQAAFFLLTQYRKPCEGGSDAACSRHMQTSVFDSYEGFSQDLSSPPLHRVQDLIRHAKLAMAIHHILEFACVQTQVAREFVTNEHAWQHQQPTQRDAEERSSMAATAAGMRPCEDKNSTSLHLSTSDPFSIEDPKGDNSGSAIIPFRNQILSRACADHYWLEMLYVRQLLPTLFDGLRRLCKFETVLVEGCEAQKEGKKEVEKDVEGDAGELKGLARFALPVSEDRPLSGQALEAFSCLSSLFNKVLGGNLARMEWVSEYDKESGACAVRQTESSLSAFTTEAKCFVHFRGPFDSISEGFFEEMTNWRAEAASCLFKLPPPPVLEPIPLHILLCGLHRFTAGVDLIAPWSLLEAMGKPISKAAARRTWGTKSDMNSYSKPHPPFIAGAKPNTCAREMFSKETIADSGEACKSYTHAHGIYFRVELLIPILQLFFNSSAFSLLTSIEEPFFSRTSADSNQQLLIERQGVSSFDPQRASDAVAHEIFSKRRVLDQAQQERAVSDLVLLLDLSVQLSVVCKSYQLAAIASLYARVLTWSSPHLEAFHSRTANSANTVASSSDLLFSTPDSGALNGKRGISSPAPEVTSMPQADAQIDILDRVRDYLCKCMDELLLASCEKGKKLDMEGMRHLSTERAAKPPRASSLAPLRVMRLLSESALVHVKKFSASDTVAFLHAFSKINAALHCNRPSRHRTQSEKGVLGHNSNDILRDSLPPYKTSTNGNLSSESWFLRMKPPLHTDLEVLLDVLATSFFTVLENHVTSNMLKWPKQVVLKFSKGVFKKMDGPDNSNRSEEVFKPPCRGPGETVTTVERPFISIKGDDHDNNENHFGFETKEREAGVPVKTKENHACCPYSIFDTPLYFNKVIHRQRSGFFFCSYTPSEFLSVVEALEALSVRPNVFEKIKTVCGLYLHAPFVASDVQSARELGIIWLKFISCASKSLFAYHSLSLLQKPLIEAAALLPQTARPLVSSISPQRNAEAGATHQSNRGRRSATPPSGDVDKAYDDPQLVGSQVDFWNRWLISTLCDVATSDFHKTVTASDMGDLCQWLRSLLHKTRGLGRTQCSHTKETVPLSLSQLPAEGIVLGKWPFKAFRVRFTHPEIHQLRAQPTDAPIFRDKDTGGFRCGDSPVGVFATPTSELGELDGGQQREVVRILLAGVLHHMAKMAVTPTTSPEFIQEAFSKLNLQHILRITFWLLQGTFSKRMLSGMISASPTNESKMANRSDSGKLTDEHREALEAVFIPLYVVLRRVMRQLRALGLFESHSPLYTRAKQAEKGQEPKLKWKSLVLSDASTEKLDERDDRSASVGEFADPIVSRLDFQVLAFQEVVCVFEKCLLHILDEHRAQLISNNNRSQTVVERSSLTSSDPSPQSSSRELLVHGKAVLTPYEVVELAILLHDEKELELGGGGSSYASLNHAEENASPPQLSSIGIVRKFLEEMLTKSLFQTTVHEHVTLLSDLSYVFVDAKGLLLPKWVMQTLFDTIQRQLLSSFAFDSTFSVESLPPFYKWSFLPFQRHFIYPDSNEESNFPAKVGFFSRYAKEMGHSVSHTLGDAHIEHEDGFPALGEHTIGATPHTKSVDRRDSKSGSVFVGENITDGSYQGSLTAGERTRSSVSTASSTDTVRATFLSFVYDSINRCETLNMLSWILRKLYAVSAAKSLHSSPSLTVQFPGEEYFVDRNFPLLRDLVMTRMAQLLEPERAESCSCSDLIEFLQDILQTELKVAQYQCVLIDATHAGRNSSIARRRDNPTAPQMSSLAAILDSLSSLSNRKIDFQKGWVSLSSVTATLRNLCLVSSPPALPSRPPFGIPLKVQKGLISFLSYILLYACELQQRIPCQFELVQLVELLVVMAPEWVSPALVASFTTSTQDKLTHFDTVSPANTKGGKLLRPRTLAASVHTNNSSSRVASGMLCMLIIMDQMVNMPHLQSHDSFVKSLRTSTPSLSNAAQGSTFSGQSEAREVEPDIDDPAETLKGDCPSRYMESPDDYDNAAQDFENDTPHMRTSLARKNMYRTLFYLQLQITKLIREYELSLRSSSNLARQMDSITGNENKGERDILISLLVRVLELGLVRRNPILFRSLSSFLKYMIETELGWRNLRIDSSVASLPTSLAGSPVCPVSAGAHRSANTTRENIVIAFDDETGEPFQVATQPVVYTRWGEDTNRVDRFRKKMKHMSGDVTLHAQQDYTFPGSSFPSTSGMADVKEEVSKLKLPSTLKFISLEVWRKLLWHGAWMFTRFNYEFILKLQLIEEQRKARRVSMIGKVETVRPKSYNTADNQSELQELHTGSNHALPLHNEGQDDGTVTSPHMDYSNEKRMHAQHSSDCSADLEGILHVLRKHYGLAILVRFSASQVSDLCKVLGPLSFTSLTEELACLYTSYTTSTERVCLDLIASAMSAYQTEKWTPSDRSFGRQGVPRGADTVINADDHPVGKEKILSDAKSWVSLSDRNEPDTAVQVTPSITQSRNFFDSAFHRELYACGSERFLTPLSAAWLQPWLSMACDCICSLASSDLELVLRKEYDAVAAQKASVAQAWHSGGLRALTKLSTLSSAEDYVGWDDNLDGSREEHIVERVMDEDAPLNPEQSSSTTLPLTQHALSLPSQRLTLDLGIVVSFLQLLEALQPHIKEQRVFSALSILQQMDLNGHMDARDRSHLAGSSHMGKGESDGLTLLRRVPRLGPGNAPPSNSVELLISILKQVQAAYTHQARTIRSDRRGADVTKNAARDCNTSVLIEATNFGAVLDYFRRTDLTGARVNSLSLSSDASRMSFTPSGARKASLSAIDQQPILSTSDEFDAMDLVSARVQDRLQRIDEKRLEEAVLELIFALPEGVENDTSSNFDAKGNTKPTREHHVILRKRLSHLQPRDLARMFSLLMQAVQMSSNAAESSEDPSFVCSSCAISTAYGGVRQEVLQGWDEFNAEIDVEGAEEKALDRILLLCEIVMDLLPSIPGADVVHIMEGVLPVWRSLEMTVKEPHPRVGCDDIVRENTRVTATSASRDTLRAIQETKSILRHELRRFLSAIPTLASSCIHRFTNLELLQIFTRLHTPYASLGEGAVRTVGVGPPLQRGGETSQSNSSGAHANGFSESLVSAAAARVLRLALTPESFVEEQEIFLEHIRQMSAPGGDGGAWEKLHKQWEQLLSPLIKDSGGTMYARPQEGLYDGAGSQRHLKELTNILAFIEVTGM